jgi:hypothetical protein
MPRAESVLMSSRQRETFAFVERDYEDTRSEGRWRRGCVGFGGGCEMSAAVFVKRNSITIPMPFGSLESTSVVALLAELAVFDGASLVMVDVDEDLLKVFARGARWVSFSFLVNFHDIACTVACYSSRRTYMG